MGHNFESTINGEMLGAPAQCQHFCVIWWHWSENTSQL